MVAEKRFSKQSFEEDKEMMMSGVSYRGMHIPFFDEKKLAVWKYQMESTFFTIGCLGIARGDAKKNLLSNLVSVMKRSPNASVSTKVSLKKETLVLTCWYSRWV
jgi:hypothetical protein